MSIYRNLVIKINTEVSNYDIVRGLRDLAEKIEKGVNPKVIVDEHGTVIGTVRIERIGI